MSEFNQVLKRILEKNLSIYASKIERLKILEEHEKHLLHRISNGVVENIEFELCHEFAGEKVYVPQPFELRNKRIVDMAKMGHHVLSIAQYFNLTEKSVKQIIKNYG